MNKLPVMQKKIFIKFSFLTISLVHISLFLNAQIFKKVELKKQDRKKGIQSVFMCSEFEYSAKVTLFNNKTFIYEEGTTNHSVFSNGKWTKERELVILNSAIDSNDVPVNIYYFRSDTVRSYYDRANAFQMNIPVYKTKFQVPINLKGSLLPDSKVFMNNDSSYCFPFFDTCIGKANSLDRIKIDFGNGFKTKWIKIKRKNFKRVLIIAQSKYLFKEYLIFKSKTFQIKGRNFIKLN
jgi:hypothetical protein